MNLYLDLFLTFAKVGVCTFGGGYAMLPILQREVVDGKGWATESELADYYAVGQCTPGIIAVNTATFVGAKEKGVPGGIAVDGDGKLRSRVTLEAVEGVSRSDFFVSNGASYVNAGGKVYQVSNKVACYNTTTKVWFTGDDPLYQIRAYSDDLTIYVDPYGEKVRVITTQ